MRRFIKKPELNLVVIPGVGRITTGQVLEGDQFAKFSPSLLVELLDSTPKAAAPVLDSKPVVAAPVLDSKPAAVAPVLDSKPKESAPILLDEGHGESAPVKPAVKPKSSSKK